MSPPPAYAAAAGPGAAGLCARAQLSARAGVQRALWLPAGAGRARPLAQDYGYDRSRAPPLLRKAMATSRSRVPPQPAPVRSLWLQAGDAAGAGLSVAAPGVRFADARRSLCLLPAGNGRPHRHCRLCAGPGRQDAPDRVRGNRPVGRIHHRWLGLCAPAADRAGARRRLYLASSWKRRSAVRWRRAI